MKKTRKQLAEEIDQFFNKLGTNPEKYDLDELITIVEAIIPVHVGLEVGDIEDVNSLLAIYPFLFQKLVKIFAYFSHKVRICTQQKKSVDASNMRSYKDAFEQLMRAVKLQYDGLSRRITLLNERRL